MFQILVLFVFHMVHFLARGQQKTIVAMRSDGLTNRPDLLQCAFKHISVEYTGIQVYNDSTGMCGPVTASEIASDHLSTLHFVKTALKMIYNEQGMQESFLDFDVPITVNVGAEFELKVHGKSKYTIDLFNRVTTDVILEIACNGNFIALDTIVGNLRSEERIDEDLTGQTSTIRLTVTSVGYEIGIDGVYKHTYSHRAPVTDIRSIMFASESGYGVTPSTLGHLYLRLL